MGAKDVIFQALKQVAELQIYKIPDELEVFTEQVEKAETLEDLALAINQCVEVNKDKLSGDFLAISTCLTEENLGRLEQLPFFVKVGAMLAAENKKAYKEAEGEFSEGQWAYRESSLDSQFTFTGEHKAGVKETVTFPDVLLQATIEVVREKRACFYQTQKSPAPKRVELDGEERAKLNLVIYLLNENHVYQGSKLGTPSHQEKRDARQEKLRDAMSELETLKSRTFPNKPDMKHELKKALKKVEVSVAAGSHDSKSMKKLSKTIGKILGGKLTEHQHSLKEQFKEARLTALAEKPGGEPRRQAPEP
jgi:hypothetical protein